MHTRTTKDIELLNNQNVDLRTSILNEIKASNYTCLVCTDYITPSSQIWSCNNCYRVFDLNCIQDWAKRGSSTKDDKSWKCPSCNFIHMKIPKKYKCWCGKSINPNLNYFEPHSCGIQCSASLLNCYHQCTLTCHPGPHIEKCNSLGPILKCYCGKNSKQLSCILTPYENGWSCDEICNDILSCGIHKCQKNCHSDLCDECNENLIVKCYCGKSNELIKCHDRLPKISINQNNNNNDSWIGNFKCNNPCNEKLDCGLHSCSLNCHQITNDCHKCPNDPSNLIYCSCGKSKINDLLEIPRKSCLDEIPNCNKICGKKLPCGHKCYWNCHNGPCSPCFRSVDVDCHCGFTHYTIACALNIQNYKPTCLTKCNAKFNCKRHFCSKRCCDYRKIAFDRSKLIKKQLRNNIITNSIADSIEFENVHTCNKICDQLLNCDKHKCKKICHSGPCPPCLESSSNDLICHCGNTIISAPVRCGTLLPFCPFQCNRLTSCGHRPEIHHCHENDISCPKCTTLVTKKCKCEKQNLVTNVMCYQENVSCFKICDKLLPCGEHKCKKVCHEIGDCQKKCIEKCLKLKKCGHPCQQLCHYNKPCNELIPCEEKVIVTCNCGRRKQSLNCYSVTKMITDLGTDNTNLIKCDEICEKEYRNKMLFEALGLNPARTKETEISLKMRSVESIYTPFLINIYSKQKTWCLSIEEIFKQLLSSFTIESNFNIMKNSELKQSYHFRPMKEIQRRFIHELAESWGLFSESHDREPKRSVFVKLLKTSKIPDISLKEAYNVYQQYKALEKKKALEKATAAQLRESRTNSNGDDIFNYYNGIIIKDVFFGITVETVDASLYSIWTQTKDDDKDERKFPLIKNGKVEFINESMYVFYGDDTCSNAEDRIEYERQIKELTNLFIVRVQEKNLALKCIPAKVDVKEGIVVEIMKNEKIEENENNEQKNDANGTPLFNDILEGLEDLKIESKTVSPEWW
jgi:transcriptional repressor NF-X1